MVILIAVELIFFVKARVKHPVGTVPLDGSLMVLMAMAGTKYEIVGVSFDYADQFPAVDGYCSYCSRSADQNKIVGIRD